MVEFLNSRSIHMDLRGHESINTALQQSGIEATVEPMPTEGHVEHVTVNTAVEVAPAKVLNALAKARLLVRRGVGDAGFRSGPQLEPLFGQPGSITFTDTNNGY
jgi:hypothetical protein